jgi:hypothetical protein
MISNTRRWTSVRLMRIDPPPISVPSSTDELNTSRKCRRRDRADPTRRTGEAPAGALEAAPASLSGSDSARDCRL